MCRGETRCRARWTTVRRAVGVLRLEKPSFVAATTHRGIRHLRMPTTVLSQNDSEVGVKNGLNAFGCKNLIGASAPPFAVINDNNPTDQLSRT